MHDARLCGCCVWPHCALCLSHAHRPLSQGKGWFAFSRQTLTNARCCRSCRSVADSVSCGAVVKQSWPAPALSSPSPFAAMRLLRAASRASWLSCSLAVMALAMLCLAHVQMHAQAAITQQTQTQSQAQTEALSLSRSSKVATLNPYRFAALKLMHRDRAKARSRSSAASSAHLAAESMLASEMRAAAAIQAELEAQQQPGQLNPGGSPGPAGPTPPAPAAPASTPPAIHITSVMKDPITNMLESKWAVVFLVFICLIILCVVAYCFREHVATCVACLETVCYHTVKTLMIPFKLLIACVKTVAYPVKQTCLACKDRMDRYLYPSEIRVSGLRY